MILLKKTIAVIYLILGILVCSLLMVEQNRVEIDQESKNLLLDIGEANGLIDIYSNLIKKIPANE